MSLYSYFPLEIDRCEKHFIYSKDGNKYIDTFSGIGVLSLGHSCKEIIEVMYEKMQRYMHLSNFFKDEDVENVESLLIESTPHGIGNAFFCNSGTEAVEACLKALSKIQKKEQHKHYILTFSGAFHGRTAGATGISEHGASEIPMRNVTRLEFNNIEGLESFFSKLGDRVLAVFVEAIQGASGVVPMDYVFAQKIMELREKHDFILICDEIQSGLGRTGKFFAFEHYDMIPDMITVAKSLGGGLPLGAALFLGKYKNIFGPGDHGSTFGPNPIALAGAKYLLEQLPSYLGLNAQKGFYLKKKLSKLKKNIKEVRGEGLMLAVELEAPIDNLRMKAFEEGLLINVVRNKIIRLLPSFTMEYEDFDKVVSIIGKIIETEEDV